VPTQEGAGSPLVAIVQVVHGCPVRCFHRENTGQRAPVP
jgi:hypothetical protein